MRTVHGEIDMNGANARDNTIARTLVTSNTDNVPTYTVIRSKQYG